MTYFLSMISIITAIHGQLAMNRLFFETLKKATHHPFELIVIDNASKDESADFFESVGVRVIRNDANYAYGYSQNQGIACAKYDWLAFLNNDVIVCPQWDALLIDTMQHGELDVASACGIERLETPEVTHRYRRRWKWIRQLAGAWGSGETRLRRMHRWMYPSWERECKERSQTFHHQAIEGFVGNTVMLRHSAIDKIGLWDPRIQAADFDLYLRTATRARDHGDIRPMHIALDAFVHHYIRLTVKGGYPPFANAKELIDLEQKWSAQDLKLLANAGC